MKDIFVLVLWLNNNWEIKIVEVEEDTTGLFWLNVACAKKNCIPNLFSIREHGQMFAIFVFINWFLNSADIEMSHYQHTFIFSNQNNERWHIYYTVSKDEAKLILAAQVAAQSWCFANVAESPQMVFKIKTQ